MDSDFSERKRKYAPAKPDENPDPTRSEPGEKRTSKKRSDPY